MKLNYILIFLFTLATFQPGWAQDQRTFETRVADALNALPANNSEAYTRTMQELINLGPEVVDELSRLYLESEGDQRVKLDLAFSGIGKFLSSASESVRGQFAEAYVESIQENSRGDMAIALLEELTFFMPDDKLSLLKPLLQEQFLQMRILDILEMHPNPASGEIIWSAMSMADNRTRFKIYKILTDARFGKQDMILNPAMANSREELGKLILKGMAESGDPEFLDYFTNMAYRNGGISPEEPDAIQIDAVIRYGSALSKKDHQSEAVDYFKNILKNGNQTIQALATYELSRIAPDQSVEELKSALISGVPEVAVAAVHALPFLETSQYGALLSSIEKAPAIAKADAIRILTRKGWSGSEELVRSGLKSQDSLVAAQAVIGLAEIQGTDAQNEILEFLKTAKIPSVIDAAVTATKMSTDKKNVNHVAGILSQVNDDKKALLIPLIADRGNESYFEQIFTLAANSEGVVQRQAITALAKLGQARHINQVLDLMSKLPDDQVKTAQVTLDQMLGASKSSDWEPTLLSAIEGEQKGRFIPLIGHLSGDKPAEMARKIFDEKDDNITNQLLSSAGEWADASMVDVVISLMENNNVYSNAFNAALGIIDRADWPGIRKILYLQKVYEKAKYPLNKVSVIQKISQFRDMYSLLVVGDYLENTTGTVQNTAAMGIMNIVMPGPQNNDGMTDSLAIDLLGKARDIVSGTDSEYFKENINTYIESIPSDVSKGYVPMFNGENLNGWHGFVANPIQLQRMTEKEIADKLKESNQRMKEHWWVEDGMIHFKGNGQNLVSDKNYGNFVMLVDWKIGDKGDSGIYLRGTPQVQIWDISRVDVGAQVGSGGLYNNQKHSSKPAVVADMPIGDWNHMKISMMNDKVSVWLNGDLVVDNVVLENFWDRSLPIFPNGPIELQAHGTDIAFKNIYIKEIPSGEDLLSEQEKKDGFVPLFNGVNLDGWTGNKTQYKVVEGVIVVDPEASGSSGNLYTEKEYSNFNFRFEFLLTPGANNGLGIRAPLSGDAAYSGVELQILDNTASIYANLKPYQYHGSLYGVAPAERGHLKPVGEWNSQEVIIKGDRYQVILNGTKILDVDARDAIKNGAMDGKEHPGLKRKKGHIGFLGHGSEVRFRNIRIKEL